MESMGLEGGEQPMAVAEAMLGATVAAQRAATILPATVAAVVYSVMPAWLVKEAPSCSTNGAVEVGEQRLPACIQKEAKWNGLLMIGMLQVQVVLPLPEAQE